MPERPAAIRPARVSRAVFLGNRDGDQTTGSRDGGPTMLRASKIVETIMGTGARRCRSRGSTARNGKPNGALARREYVFGGTPAIPNTDGWPAHFREHGRADSVKGGMTWNGPFYILPLESTGLSGTVRPRFSVYL
jgi:hypothetical protein